MIVVSDTSILNYLVQLDCAALLPELFGQVIIPPIVSAEIAASERPAMLQLLQSSWIVRKELTGQAHFLELLKVVDAGEAQAIALARELEAGLLLVDDKKGRREAIRAHLRPLGLLGIPLQAKDNGRLATESPC